MKKNSIWLNYIRYFIPDNQPTLLPRKLLEYDPLLQSSFSGKSPLEIAAERGHSTLVKTLIEKGALQHLDDGKLFYFHLKLLISNNSSFTSTHYL